MEGCPPWTLFEPGDWLTRSRLKFVSGRRHAFPGNSPKACLWPGGVHQEQREAFAQFFSNEVQFNITDTGCNAAVEVTGMGKRNLLPSGLIAQLTATTVPC